MRKRKGSVFFYLKEVTVGIVLSVAAIFALFVYNNSALSAEFFLYETIPFYDYNVDIAQIFKAVPNENAGAKGGGAAKLTEAGEPVEVFSQNTPVSGGTGGITKIEAQSGTVNGSDIIGTSGITYQSDVKEYDAAENTFNPEALTNYNIDDLRRADFLKNNFYTVDRYTEMLPQDFDADSFLATDLKIDTSTGGPKVLIFHTHMYEGFVGGEGINEGVYGAGERLAKALREKYGIEVIHCAERFDIVDGTVQVLGAYERMEPVITKILADNPTIEVAIDIHRDGVLDNTTKYVTEIDGRPTAKIMFFNGLSVLKENGKVTRLNHLPNPNQQSNLAFSFNMQLAANEIFPSFTRKIYLKTYRYSLHMLPKSLLVEIGTQNNTVEEAFNAMDVLAELLAGVILPPKG